MFPTLSLLRIDLARLNLEGNSLIGFGGDEEVLVGSVGWLNVLLKCGHESMTGDDVGSDLWVMNLKE